MKTLVLPSESWHDSRWALRWRAGERAQLQWLVIEAPPPLLLPQTHIWCETRPRPSSPGRQVRVKDHVSLLLLQRGVLSLFDQRPVREHKTAPRSSQIIPVYCEMEEKVISSCWEDQGKFCGQHGNASERSTSGLALSTGKPLSVWVTQARESNEQEKGQSEGPSAYKRGCTWMGISQVCR